MMENWFESTKLYGRHIREREKKKVAIMRNRNRLLNSAHLQLNYLTHNTQAHTTKVIIDNIKRHIKIYEYKKYMNIKNWKFDKMRVKMLINLKTEMMIGTWWKKISKTLHFFSWQCFFRSKIFVLNISFPIFLFPLFLMKKK